MILLKTTMPKVSIKPLSVNKAWKGQQFSTDEKKVYEQQLLWLLPKLEIPEGKLKIWFVFGLSSTNADYDNFIKVAQDTISKKYGFNDNKIYRALVDKHDVPKGKEFIAFSITRLHDKEF